MVLHEIEEQVAVGLDRNYYLLNIPYTLVYHSTTPIFWELPFNQVLLQHAIEDYLDLKGLYRNNIWVLNYLYLQPDYAALQIETQFVSDHLIQVQVYKGAIPSPFPWSKIPGRSQYDHLFKTEGGIKVFHEEPQEGWSKEMTIQLTDEALQKPNLNFLIYDGSGMVQISKKDLYGST